MPSSEEKNNDQITEVKETRADRKPQADPAIAIDPERLARMHENKKRFHRKRRIKDWAMFTGYLTPSLVGVMVFFFLPLLLILKTSFQRSSTNTDFVGIENYERVLTNEAFLNSAKNSLTFSGIAVPLSVVLALLLAILLNTKLPGESVFRSVLLNPMMVPVASVVLIWQVFFSYNGVVNGITEKLDYLKELGAGALWLTPCYRSPQADNGYDIADYYEIDEMFGTTEDMERLISEAGKRGIRIVMDLVFNHTSEQNPWFIESSSSRDNAKSDWYIWRDAKPDGSAPTNWRSIFGGSAWTWCEARQQYYLHTFLKEQPDLNWENPDMRNALYDAALYWVKKGVGGFRMDAVTYIKKPAFQDGTPDYGDGM